MMASITEAGRKYSPSPLHAWRRFLGIVFGLALLGAGLWLTIALAIVPPFSAWPLKVGLGGVIGKLGRDGIAHINIAPPLSAMAAAALVTLMLLYLLGWSFISFAPRGETKSRYVRPSARRQEAAAAPRLWARLLAPLAVLPP